MSLWNCPRCEHVNRGGKECASCGHERTKAEIRASRIEDWGLSADVTTEKLYRGSEPVYLKKSMLDRLVPPIGWIVAGILVLSVLPFVAPLFLFELPDLTQTLVDGCATGSQVETDVDCGTQPWLRLVAVAQDDYGLYVALSPNSGDEGDYLNLVFATDEYRAERGTNGVWAVTNRQDAEFDTIGVATKSQNGFEMLAIPISGNLDRWAVSTSRSRTPPSGLFRTPQLSTLTSSVAIPSWAPWALLAGLLIWGFRAGTPSRVRSWARWILFLSIVGWALSTIKPHLDQALGRFAVSENYPVLVPIGLGAAMAVGVPWLAFVIARSLSRQLPRWSVLSDDHTPRSSEVVIVKILGSVALVLLTYIAVIGIDAGIARLFPGFTI